MKKIEVKEAKDLRKAREEWREEYIAEKYRTFSGEECTLAIKELSMEILFLVDILDREIKGI